MKQTSTQFKKSITPNKRRRYHHHHHTHNHIIPYLPKEILEEIFNKVSLPIKTITEFQNLTYCSQISSIFSNSKFVESQINNYTLPCFLAYTADHNEFFLIEGQKGKFFSMEINMDFMPNHGTTTNMEILNSCNGLLLSTDRRSLWVVNPLTREIISLPKSDDGFFSGDKSYYVMGFSLQYDKFKIVRLVGSLRQAVGGYYLEFYWYAEVLTLGTDTWRKIDGCDLLFQNAIIEDEGLAMINGALYWSIHVGHKQEIVRFDIDSEEFELIPSPLDEEGLGFGYSLSSLGTVDNLLCVARYERRRSCNEVDLSHEMEIWVLRDCGVWNLWRKISVIYYKNMRCVRKFELIKVSENEIEILMMLQDPLKLVYYDTKKNTVRETLIEGVDCNKMKGVMFCPNLRSITTYI